MQEINHPANPFPGLRPFESNETHLFFGRDGQSEELLRRLKRTRFLAVVGTSGSGKSSLVRAGLLPALQGGLMASAGSDWRIAILRPGGDPIGNLARALASPAVLGTGDARSADMQAVLAETTLRRSSLGLVELVRRARTKLDEYGKPLFADYENLLVVVDQFEELFRFKQLIEEENSKEDAAAFVKLLLEAVGHHEEKKIYVVLTMRSDFLGDCAQFWELPEAINNGQYLIPRMSRDERRAAITGPVAVGQGAISEPLVNQLLNDVGDNPDQLPILQHALMRTWDYWLNHRRNGEPIDIPDYNATGGMAEALSRHADEAYAELDAAQQVIAEKLFKGLTERGADNREIRRPIEVQEICELTGADEASVIAVIEVFRREGRSFLMPPPTDALTGAHVRLNGESLIDISHESLIRNWERLKTWVDEESRSARIYRRLAETAVLHREGGAGLWRDPDLQVALTWREHTSPNEVWARRYHPEFASAMSFLDASVAARDVQAASEEAHRLKEIKRTRLTALIFGVAFLFSLAMGGIAWSKQRQAVEFLRDAKSAQRDTERALAAANIEREKAVIAQAEANVQKDKAVTAQNEAIERAEDAKEARSQTEEALEQAKRKNEEAARANIAMQAAQSEAVKRAKAAEEAQRSAREESEKNVRAKEANDKFREATALAERGKFDAAEELLHMAIASYRDPYVNNKEAVADTYVELAHNKFLVGYDYFIETNGDLKNVNGARRDAEESRNYYDEAANIYANPPINAPEKAATTLLSLGMMLMNFTEHGDGARTMNGGSANLTRAGGLDEDVPVLSLTPPEPGGRYYLASPDTEDVRVKFERQAVERFQRALELYERAFNEYTKDTSQTADVRDALLKSARAGMAKSAFQAGNYYRNEANELDAQGTPVEAVAAEQRFAGVREYNRRAAQYFEKLLELYTPSQDASVGNLLVWLGGLYYDMDDKPTAEKYFSRALAGYASARPDLNKAQALSSMAATLEQAGQIKSAIIFLERALAEHKTSGDLPGEADASYKIGRILEGQYKRGWSFLSHKRYEKALEVYRQAPDRIDPRHLDNLFYLGAFWEKSGDYKLALDALRLATTVSNRSNKDEAHAYDEIGSLLSLTGQTKEAIAAYERAYSIYKAIPGAQQRNDDLTNLNRVRRTIEALKAALRQPPPTAATGSS